MNETLPAYDVKVVDTTGAGDAFFGAVLFRLRSYTDRGLNSIRADEWHDILDFANAAGSLTTAKKGAIPAMPTLQAIENCRRTMSLLKA
jgi:fructokinase